jgi:hypothetical protein
MNDFLFVKSSVSVVLMLFGRFISVWVAQVSQQDVRRVDIPVLSQTSARLAFELSLPLSTHYSDTLFIQQIARCKTFYLQFGRQVGVRENVFVNISCKTRIACQYWSIDRSRERERERERERWFSTPFQNPCY